MHNTGNSGGSYNTVLSELNARHRLKLWKIEQQKCSFRAFVASSWASSVPASKFSSTKVATSILLFFSRAFSKCSSSPPHVRLDAQQILVSPRAVLAGLRAAKSFVCLFAPWGESRFIKEMAAPVIRRPVRVEGLRLGPSIADHALRFSVSGSRWEGI